MKKAWWIGLVAAMTLGLLAGCASEKELKACKADNEKLTADNAKLKENKLKADGKLVEGMQKITEYAAQQKSKATEADKIIAQLRQKDEENQKLLADEQQKTKLLQDQVEQSKQAMVKSAEIMKTLQGQIDALKAENEKLKPAGK